MRVLVSSENPTGTRHGSSADPPPEVSERSLIAGGPLNLGATEASGVTLTVDVPGHPPLLSGQVITLSLQDQRAWAVPTE